MRKQNELQSTTDHASEIFAAFLRRFAQREPQLRVTAPFAFRRSVGVERANVSPPRHEHAPDLRAFVDRMHVEIRRSARSRRALSLALFRLEADAASHGQWMRLWDVVRRRKRETDIVGHVGHNLAAALLVDTDEAGAQAFMRDILARAGALQVTSAAQAHPGHLFANLMRDDAQA